MSLSILDAAWLPMTPTKTFARRTCYWVPGVSLTHKGDVSDAYACAIHQSAKRSGAKIYDGQYQVEFTGDAIGSMAYRFIFHKLWPDDPPKPNERESPYEVLVGPNLFKCSCTASTCRVDVCRHRSAACAAIAAGLVDGAKDWPGMPESEAEWA